MAVRIAPPIVATVVATLTTVEATSFAFSVFLLIINSFLNLTLCMVGLVEFFEFEIVLVAASLLIVEGVYAHVCFLDFLCSVGERICRVDCRRNGH